MSSFCYSASYLDPNSLYMWKDRLRRDYDCYATIHHGALELVKRLLEEGRLIIYSVHEMYILSPKILLSEGKLAVSTRPIMTIVFTFRSQHYQKEANLSTTQVQNSSLGTKFTVFSDKC